MTIAPTTAAGSVATSGKPTTVGFGQLKSEDFFALMIAELQSQDPLKPADNQQLLSQMSNIRQIEQSTRLADTLDSQMKALETQTKILQKLTSERFSDPASLIGLYVQGPGVNENGEPVIGSDGRQVKIEGLVIGIEYKNGQAILKLHTGESMIANTVEKVKIVVAEDGLAPDVSDETDGADESGEDDSTEGPSGQNTPPSDDVTARWKPVTGSTYGMTAEAARVNAVATLLDSLLSPGMGIQMGV